jgi:hypothetical protein
VAEGGEQLTLDILLKKSMRRAPILLSVALPKVGRSKGMEATVVSLVFVVVVVVVGTLVAMRMAPIMIEIGVVLRYGKVS